MEISTMRCPSCNATLEIENGIDSFYCKYCGTRIMISGQDKHAVRAKTLLSIIDKIQQADEADRKYYEEHREEIETRRKQEERRNNLQILMAIGVIVVIPFIVFLVMKLL